MLKKNGDKSNYSILYIPNQKHFAMQVSKQFLFRLYLQNWVGAELLKILSWVSLVRFTNMDLFMTNKKRLFIGCFKGEKCLKPILLVYMWHYGHISTHYNNFIWFWNYIYRGLIWSRNSCVRWECWGGKFYEGVEL